MAKCRRGKLFARDRVGFGQDRRNALTLRLIGEAVEIVLLRKLVGGTREIAEQIANRVVVLAVREPADRGSRSGSAIGLQSRQRRIQIARRQLGEVGDPRLERGLFGSALLDALAAAVGYARGRLSEQERSVRIVAIHDGREAQSERADNVRLCIRQWEMHAGRRGDTVVVVAHPAFGCFEHRIDFVHKKAVV